MVTKGRTYITHECFVDNYATAHKHVMKTCDNWPTTLNHLRDSIAAAQPQASVLTLPTKHRILGSLHASIESPIMTNSPAAQKRLAGP